MSTFYSYNPDGSVADAVVRRGPYKAQRQTNPPPQKLSSNHAATEPSADPVGNSLDQRGANSKSAETATGSHNGSESNVDEHDGRTLYGGSSCDESIADHDADLGVNGAHGTDPEIHDSRATSSHQVGVGGDSQRTSSAEEYTDVSLEARRMNLDIHSFVTTVSWDRLSNTWSGPELDICEADTHVLFGEHVPKKALNLFFGHSTIAKFLRTVGQEDKLNRTDSATKQILVIPEGVANQVGFKILLRWMERACTAKSREKIPQINAPIKLFRAISLARTMGAVGLRIDAARVNKTIAQLNLTKPLEFCEVRSIWRLLPRDSVYTYHIVNELRRRLYYPNRGKRFVVEDPDVFKDFISKNPELQARIDSEEKNERFRPIFDTNRRIKLFSMPIEANAEKLLAGDPIIARCWLNQTFTPPAAPIDSPAENAPRAHQEA